MGHTKRRQPVGRGDRLVTCHCDLSLAHLLVDCGGGVDSCIPKKTEHSSSEIPKIDYSAEQIKKLELPEIRGRQ